MSHIIRRYRKLMIAVRLACGNKKNAFWFHKGDILIGSKAMFTILGTNSVSVETSSAPEAIAEHPLRTMRRQL